MDALQYFRVDQHTDLHNETIFPDAKPHAALRTPTKTFKRYGNLVYPLIKVYFMIFNSFIVYFCAHYEIFLYLAKVVRHLRDAIVCCCLMFLLPKKGDCPSKLSTDKLHMLWNKPQRGQEISCIYIYMTFVNHTAVPFLSCMTSRQNLCWCFMQ